MSLLIPFIWILFITPILILAYFKSEKTNFRYLLFFIIYFLADMFLQYFGRTLINPEIFGLKFNWIGKLIKILLSEILYVEAQDDYLKFVIKDAVYTTLGTLKAMEEVLVPPVFFRIQRSFILNPEAVRSLNGNTVELTDGKTISIALNKKEEFYKILGIK